MEPEKVLENLTEDIVAYVMQGKIQEDVLAETIKYDELDDRFEDYQRLMDLHFVLQEEIVDFVEELQHSVRSIKTQTKNVEREKRGTIDGRINWSSTIQKRYSTNPRDSSLFICENRSENYDIDENIVLKKLISIIYNSLQDAEEWIKHDYSWVNESWRENEDLIQRLNNIFERNVHVTRIKDPESYEPTDRMLDTAHNSRQPIYRKAAELLENYRDIQKGEEEALKDMLQKTIITPEDEDTLFELYVLFRFIAVLLEMEEGDFSVKTIQRRKQEVARLENDRGQTVKIYHDKSGGRGISFIYDKATRPKEVKDKSQEVIEEVLGDDSGESTKRPDVLLIEVQEGENTEYLITEVKNSKENSTIRRGIREGLEYLAFLQEDGEFRFHNDEDYDHGIFGNEYNGLLVVQDTEKIDAPLQEQDHPLKVLQARQLLEEDENAPLRIIFQNLLTKADG